MKMYREQQSQVSFQQVGEWMKIEEQILLIAPGKVRSILAQLED